MLFTSLEFLFLFFPIVLTVNFILPKFLRNYWLLAASLFFYGWGEPKFVFFMIGSILFNYCMALLIAGTKAEAGKASLRKLLMAFAVAGNLSVMFVYKYLNFTTEILHQAFPWTGELFTVTSFVLPIGISFFTFQALSYVIDVYRGVPVQKNPAKIGLYVALFPQLIAGPIVRYTTVAEEIEQRTVTVSDFSAGVKRFLLGFNKKVLLANSFAVVADAAWAAGDRSILLAWLGGAAYTLQIFFDFAGYSEMAIGIGRMLGFHFLENFNYPYISKTISEFWRRWHMSLGSWFRDYVYFPLGGSRVKSKGRLVWNLFVVWLLTGIWHGANWTFLLWGMLWGVLITVEKLTGMERRIKNNSKITGIYRVFTMLAVMFGLVLFRSADIGEAVRYLGSMFGLTGNPASCEMAVSYLREYRTEFAAGILCSTPVFAGIKQKLSTRGRAMEVFCELGAFLVQLLLFLVSVSYLVMNAHNPFIYFNF